jgi:hypothetical protein
MGIRSVDEASFLSHLIGNPHPISLRAVFPTSKAFQWYLSFHLTIGFEPAVEELLLYSPIADI